MTDLRKLSEAATPGEWEHADHFADVRFDREIWPVGGLEEGLAYANASDAAFIAALVNDFRSGSLIPRSEYERVLALLAEAREAGSKVLTRGETLEMRKARTRLRNVLSRIDDTLAAEREARG